MKRTTLEEKLRTALTTTALARAADPLPSPPVEYRFRAWSDALRAVVCYRLSPYGSIEEWSHNPDCLADCAVFSFHLNIRVEPQRGRPMFVSTRLRFDAARDLDDELARLTFDAKFYTDRTNRMWGDEEDK